MRLLEIGLADASFVSEASRQRLIKRLAPSREDFAWVADIVAIALGSHEALDAPAIDRVVADLEAIETGITRRDQALTDELVEDPPDAPAPVSLEPGMFDVLRVLSEGENYTYGIWEKVHEQSRQFAVGEIGVLLLRMIGKNLIEKIGQRYDPALDDEPLQYYRITAMGRRAYHVERTRQAREERERKEEDTMIKGGVKPAPQS